MEKSQIVFSNACYRKSKKETFLNDFKKLEVKRIEFLAASPYYSCFDYPQKKDRQNAITEWIRILEEYKFEIYAFVPEYHCYPVNLGDINPEIRKRSVLYYKDYIEDASYLGAEYIYVNPGWYYADKSDKDEFCYAVDSLYSLIEEAKRNKIKLLVGSLETEQTNIVHNCETLVLLLEQIKEPVLYAALELNTLAALGENPRWYINSLGGRIACCRTSSLFDQYSETLKLWKKYLKNQLNVPLVFNLENTENLLNPKAAVTAVLENINYLSRTED